jgi:hypothetical protein
LLDFVIETFKFIQYSRVSLITPISGERLARAIPFGAQQLVLSSSLLAAAVHSQ